MAESKRIIISLPDSLLREVDDIVEVEKRNRSECIREAMRLYIHERKKVQIRETMKKGYKEMGAINLSLAETGMFSDFQALEGYVSKLAECE